MMEIPIMTLENTLSFDKLDASDFPDTKTMTFIGFDIVAPFDRTSDPELHFRMYFHNERFYVSTKSVFKDKLINTEFAVIKVSDIPIMENILKIETYEEQVKYLKEIDASRLR